MPSRRAAWRRLATSALRRDRSDLNVNAWAAFRSRRGEKALDRSIALERTLTPFAEPPLNGDVNILGPYLPFVQWTETERAYCLDGPLWLEPGCGWAICSPAHLILHGIIDMHDAPLPSFRQHVQSMAVPVRRRWRADEAVSLRDRSENNYGHFLTDLVGGRLRLAEQAGVGEEVPLVVSAQLASAPHFQDFMALSRFRDRPLLVQSDQRLFTGRLWLFDTTHYSPESARYIQDVLQLPIADPAADRRLLVLRSHDKSGRAFTNGRAVVDLCRRFGIEAIAPEQLCLKEQIDLFSQARLVVGVTGSGLSNILYRRGAPLTVLEILPPGQALPMPWWFYMAMSLGHQHLWLATGEWDDGAEGRAARARDFTLDTDLLAARLAAVLDQIGTV